MYIYIYIYIYIYKFVELMKTQNNRKIHKIMLQNLHMESTWAHY